jgi:major membrane immunogen (membrane-anchored lipoprotein)
MKKITLIIALIISAISFANAQYNSSKTYVSGYTKSNGTYVQGHYRTSSNSTINDNYSTYPNVNPHTGKLGTVKPDYATPTYSQKSTYNSTKSHNSYSNSTKSYNSYSTPTYRITPSPQYKSVYRNNR